MAKGKITLPKDIRDRRGGFHIRPDSISALSSIYAMKVFQKEMEGEAEKAGLKHPRIVKSAESPVVDGLVQKAVTIFRNGLQVHFVLTRTISQGMIRGIAKAL